MITRQIWIMFYLIKLFYAYVQEDTEPALLSIIV